MMGDVRSPGILVLAVKHIFDAIEDMPDREFLVRVSYMEIYQEQVCDLLGDPLKRLKVHEREKGAFYVGELREEITNSAEKMLTIMKRGDRNRTTAETSMNERSSRSHAVFCIIIESRLREDDGTGANRVSHLNLVDLAGSEKLDQTGAQGERLKEGRSINLSLLTLSCVVSQLSEGKRQFINFRGSKLTQILRSSLAGNAKIAIICTVTPAAIEETQSTLGFASRAKTIKTDPHVNEDLSDEALLKRNALKIKMLEKELEVFREGGRVEEMEKERKEKERMQQISNLKDWIVSNMVPPSTEQFRSAGEWRHALPVHHLRPQVLWPLTPNSFPRDQNHHHARQTRRFDPLLRLRILCAEMVYQKALNSNRTKTFLRFTTVPYRTNVAVVAKILVWTFLGRPTVRRVQFHLVQSR